LKGQHLLIQLYNLIFPHKPIAEKEKEKKPKSTTVEKKNIMDGDAQKPKLPYFHRTLSTEDSKLIGDITPKCISSSPQPIPTPVGGSGKSAWNNANTWEEKDYSSWALGSMKQTISSKKPSITHVSNGINYNLSVGDVSRSSKVSKKVVTVNGNANVTHIRGTARFMYEINIENVPFSLSAGSLVFDGLVNVSDVINDQFDDIEIAIVEMKPCGTIPDNINKASQECKGLLTKGKDALLKKALKEYVSQFENEFQQMYREKIGK
jgi:hypothetical protein